MSELSLVVPVYNVSPYLPRFLESAATLDPRRVEVIFVDDGSTDECPALLASFATGRSHVRVHGQENRGLSGARNAGLDRSSAPFIAFADPDDWFDAGYYERLLELCTRHSLDMAVGNASFHYEGRKPDAPIYTDNIPPAPMAGAELLRLRLERRNLLHMVWMHVYRRALLDRIGIRFIDRRIHEDVPWTTAVLIAAARVAVDPTPGYHYRIRLRHAGAEEQDRRIRAVIDSSVANAKDLDAIAAGLSANLELQRLVRWQLVDGNLSVFHKLRRIQSRAARRACEALLRRERFHELLWRNATEFAQRRRIARARLRGWLGIR